MCSIDEDKIKSKNHKILTKLNELSKNLDGKPFVRIIKEEAGNIILCTTNDNVKTLATMKTWLMDGTFKTMKKIGLFI